MKILSGKTKFGFTVIQLLLVSLSVQSQGMNPAVGAMELGDVFKPARIKEGDYTLVMYNQNGASLSNIALLKREIINQTFESKLCIKITETLTQGATRNRTTVYVDAKTLSPLFYEMSANDTLVQKATFENGKSILQVFADGVEKRSEQIVSAKSFLSNSFSELIQAVDFEKTNAVKFETFSPGKPSNQYVAERIDEKEFTLQNNQKIATWVLRFTRIDSKGAKTLAGYRYVDKVYGKVLMYKSDIKAENFFTYQTLFLQ
jgi:hypothetical protein